MKTLTTTLLATALALGNAAHAERYDLPPQDIGVVGKIQIISAREGETFAEIGREYALGFEALEKANRSLDPLYLKEGNQVFLPTRFILPNTPREGIVINLTEMRLYYYTPDQSAVYAYAIGIGRQGRDTPLGVHSIIEKRKDPSWTPPASIRAEHAAEGHPLPAVVPPGPENPLGTRAMRLSNPSYLIHGTHRPDGVGMRVSSGCIRLHPESVEELFDMVSNGTKVNIVKQHMKVGWYGDSLYLEYHSPLEEDGIPDDIALQQARDVVYKAVGERGYQVADELIDAVVREASGLPVEVAYY
ncbi:MAG: L,D-transpeptidase family protein [Cardiobacteriaceae bacterium]|nr:L,D-transpeptidase family protein [Cardiobacteriaceae bacterium]